MAAENCTCKGCQIVYVPKAKDRNSYCSRECAYKNIKQWYRVREERPDRLTPSCKVFFIKCDICLKTFAHNQSTARTCSQSCRSIRARKALVAKHVTKQFACKNCGASCHKEYGSFRSVFCSDQCLKKYEKRTTRGRENHRRRARRFGAVYQPIKPESVFKRDGWRCQMCGRSTPKRLRGTTDLKAPELDHRVPLALGGSHTLDNVQCSCRNCNILKGSRFSSGQIPLFHNVA